MPIREFLEGHKFDPEIMRIMGVAFEMARSAFRSRPNEVKPADERIAKRIVELTVAGERDPNVLCERALSYLRTPV